MCELPIRDTCGSSVGSFSLCELFTAHDTRSSHGGGQDVPKSFLSATKKKNNVAIGTEVQLIIVHSFKNQKHTKKMNRQTLASRFPFQMGVSCEPRCWTLKTQEI